MDRRDFLAASGIGLSGFMIPGFGNAVAAEALLTKLDPARKKVLADIALNAATARRRQLLRRAHRPLPEPVRDHPREQGPERHQHRIDRRRHPRDRQRHLGLRRHQRPDATDGVAKAAQQAVAIAKANSSAQTEPVQLAQVKGVGEVSWRTPIRRTPWKCRSRKRPTCCWAPTPRRSTAGANFVNSMLFLVNEQKYFASTDGSYIDQDVHRIWAPFTVTAIDKASGKFRTPRRPVLADGHGLRVPRRRPSAKSRCRTAWSTYGNSYDMIEDAVAAAKQAQREAEGAVGRSPASTTWCSTPSHLWLTIHESVGHPLELDRVLGYEANYAGTSFATLDKRQGQVQVRQRQGHPVRRQDRSQARLGAVGYDDEGVKTKRWDLVKDGILVNYQAIRDQAHILGETESHGCCYADTWRSVQFQRMPNVSLAPGNGQAQRRPT